ncbi:MAG: hypothetical protein QGF33_08030, partial [Alphaproteobacteria bacterium]|nr:hypothetical protein [Alphaproteobacteria bacterium]
IVSALMSLLGVKGSSIQIWPLRPNFQKNLPDFQKFRRGVARTGQAGFYTVRRRAHSQKVGW